MEYEIQEHYQSKHQSTSLQISLESLQITQHTNRKGRRRDMLDADSLFKRIGRSTNPFVCPTPVNTESI